MATVFGIFQGKTFKSLYLHFYLTQKCGTWTIGKLYVRSTKVSHHGCHSNIKLFPWQPLFVFFKVKHSNHFISPLLFNLEMWYLDHWKALCELYQSQSLWLPWQHKTVAMATIIGIFQGKTFKSLYLHFYLTQKCGTWTFGKLYESSIKVNHYGCHGNHYLYFSR